MVSSSLRSSLALMKCFTIAILAGSGEYRLWGGSPCFLTPSLLPLTLGALGLYSLTSSKTSGLSFISLVLQFPAQPLPGFTLSLGLFMPPATCKHAMGGWHL